MSDMKTIGVDGYPEKGKAVWAVSADGSEYWLFRCDCANLKCKEWRDELTGQAVMAEITKWEYSPRQDKPL